MLQFRILMQHQKNNMKKKKSYNCLQTRNCLSLFTVLVKSFGQRKPQQCGPLKAFSQIPLYLSLKNAEMLTIKQVLGTVYINITEYFAYKPHCNGNSVYIIQMVKTVLILIVSFCAQTFDTFMQLGIKGKEEKFLIGQNCEMSQEENDKSL